MMLPGLDAALMRLAADGSCTTYGTLAADLGLDGAGRIARLASALEATMEQDARAGHPLRAARVLGRISGGLPARGFFAKARELGVYDGPDDGPAAQRFHAAQFDP